ncbi:MAG: hypothetical protein IPH78_14905 [Bacteroidetes bacterium]|nr:hypothetical protein [Bacteroidota bacterium]
MQLYGVNHITIRNFHLTNYNEGIGTWNSNYLNFENVICAYLGNIYHPGGYNGAGISISNTSYSKVKSAFVYNSSAEGISVTSSEAAPASYNTISHCFVFCDDTTKSGLPVATVASTDYLL